MHPVAQLGSLSVLLLKHRFFKLAGEILVVILLTEYIV